MLLDGSRLAQQITSLQAATTARWMESDPTARRLDNPYTGVLAAVCQQHQTNFLLWKEETKPRPPAKPVMDALTRQRYEGIEKVDQTLVRMLITGGVVADAKARLNTESPGCAIDRLSVLSLNAFGAEQQRATADVNTPEHEQAQQQGARCRVQLADLTLSVGELLADIFAGRRLLKAFRPVTLGPAPLAPLEEETRRAG